MPFRHKCRITLENIGDSEQECYYQFNYTLCDIPEECAYFHAQFRASNPVEGGIHTILDDVKEKGITLVLL